MAASPPGAVDVEATLLDAAETLVRTGETCRASIAFPAWSAQPALLAFTLAEQARRAGAAIFEHTRVDGIESMASAVDVWTSAGVRIRCQSVIVATGAWSVRGPTSVVHTWMFASEPLGELVPCGEDVLVGRLARGFVYRRTHGGRLLFGGLDDAASAPLPPGRIPDDVLPRLRRLLATSLPALRDVDIDVVWGGPVSHRRTELPSVKPSAKDPRIIEVTGLAGAGLVWGLLMGELVRGLVDPTEDEDGARRLRGALSRSRLPVAGALALGARFALGALVHP